MEITIYSKKTINSLVNVSDRQKSFKKREGCKPAYQQSVISISIEADKINKKWKNDVSNKIGRVLPPLYKVSRIGIKDGENTYYLEMNTSNTSIISNVIANYILQKRNPLQIDNTNYKEMLL